MATVLQIIQQFCQRKNLKAPSAIVGVNSQNELQLLSLFQFVGDQLRGQPVDWPQLKRTYIFNTQTGVSQYQLPGDFYKILDNTQRDNTNKWGLQGPVSDAIFALQVYGYSATINVRTARVIGAQNYATQTATYLSPVSSGLFEVSPAGANNTDQLMLQYISRNWMWPKSWQTAEAAITPGTLRAGINNIYSATTSGTAGATMPSWTSGIQSDGAVSWATSFAAYSIASDTDICLFDTDVMIEGLRWAYNRESGADYQQEMNDWYNSSKTMFSRYNGPATINAGDEIGDTYDNVWPNLPNRVVI